MGAADDLDPTESVLTFFATEMRRVRMEAGMKQQEFASRAHLSPSLLCKIEAAERVPTEDLARCLDETFGTGGHFERLWPVVVKYAYPTWFRPYVELEEQSTIIRSFEAQLIPGLLQTECYARAVLSGRRPDSSKLDEMVFARMHRQRILTGEDPPRLWVVLDENAVRRRIGGASVMRAQLIRLRQATEVPRIVVQVVPADVSTHPALAGSFALLSFAQGPEVIYEESFYEGHLRAEPEVVTTTHHAYDLLRAHALSPEASAHLITDAIKDLTS